MKGGDQAHGAATCGALAELHGEDAGEQDAPKRCHGVCLASSGNQTPHAFGAVPIVMLISLSSVLATSRRRLVHLMYRIGHRRRAVKDMTDLLAKRKPLHALRAPFFGLLEVWPN